MFPFGVALLIDIGATLSIKLIASHAYEPFHLTQINLYGGVIFISSA